MLEERQVLTQRRRWASITEAAATMGTTSDDLIRKLSLVPLPHEGGFFRETYRSRLRLPAAALPDGVAGERDASTAIYYLLTGTSFSALHRLKSDEVFHFYLGDPVEMLQLLPDGKNNVLVLGADIAAGMSPQSVVPAGVWQGSRLLAGGEFAVLGATTAPGFDFADFELGDRARLMTSYPEQAEMIAALTRESSPPSLEDKR